MDALTVSKNLRLLGKASKKKSHKLGLFAQPPLTPPSLLNLGPLSDYTFLALKTLFKGKNALCLRVVRFPFQSANVNLYCYNGHSLDIRSSKGEVIMVKFFFGLFHVLVHLEQY